MFTVTDDQVKEAEAFVKEFVERNAPNDELGMPCPQCARKHISAAIAEYALMSPEERKAREWSVWGEMLVRAAINLTEAAEGYASHRAFAVGLLVLAEQYCDKPERLENMRITRLMATSHPIQNAAKLAAGMYLGASPLDRYHAHIAEAEREFPDIRTAVEREPFYRDNMSEPELRQAEVNYRLAQLRWLDENVFGYQPKEKGGEEMASCKKAAQKGGCVKKAGKVRMTKLVKGNRKGK